MRLPLGATGLELQIDVLSHWNSRIAKDDTIMEHLHIHEKKETATLKKAGINFMIQSPFSFLKTKAGT